MPRFISLTVHAFLSFCLFLPSVPAFAGTADREASPSVRSLLSYWESLPSRDENRVVSGQFIGHVQKKKDPGYMQQVYDRHVTALYEQTGRWVAMVGADYGLLAERDEPVDLSATNRPLIAHWNRGGLVTVSWHARNPWTGGNARDKTVRGDFSDLIMPGTGVNRVWMEQLDRIAGALSELQDAGVVVLWRPFHEGNGKAFWWAQPRTASERINLWRHMFRFFTEEKGLHNLLWVYSALPQVEGKRSPEDHGFPGEDVVDMVGLDIYAPNLEFDRAYNRLRAAAPGKPFWLTEFGPFKGSKNDPALQEAHYDYTRLIRDIRRRYPEITGFQSWNRSWSLVGQKNSKQLLEHPWVITLEELDWKTVQ